MAHNRSAKVEGIREWQRQLRESKTADELEKERDQAERSIEDQYRRSADKVRENRARRAAQRQGLQLMKSRRRDPRAIDYGGYMIVDPYTNSVVAGAAEWAYTMDLDQVEQYLADTP